MIGGGAVVFLPGRTASLLDLGLSVGGGVDSISTPRVWRKYSATLLHRDSNLWPT